MEISADFSIKHVQETRSEPGGEADPDAGDLLREERFLPSQRNGKNCAKRKRQVTVRVCSEVSVRSVEKRHSRIKSIPNKVEFQNSTKLGRF